MAGEEQIPSVLPPAGFQPRFLVFNACFWNKEILEDDGLLERRDQDDWGTVGTAFQEVSHDTFISFLNI